MDRALADAVGAALGTRVLGARRRSGGDINEACVAELADGRRVFVKTNARADRRMFPAEAHGLEWLRRAGAIRVPHVLAVSPESGAGPAFLVLEYIDPGRPAPDFEVRFGRGLAALHAAGPPTFGLDRDNFIGSLPQSNAPCESWPDFYATRRIEPQIRRAVDSGRVPASWSARFDRLAGRLPALCGPDEPPARLHGDLWSGNVMADADGAPCLIDPAVYGGHREVDLAMLRLFGSPSPRFFDAYDDVRPRAEGHADRVALYQLYPLLVHVNLFGGGYVAAASDALSRYGC